MFSRIQRTTVTEELRERVNRFHGWSVLGYLKGRKRGLWTDWFRNNEVTLEKDMVPINGSPCYVITMESREGRFKVWIDPNHGCNFARAEFLQREGDLRYGEPLPKGLNVYNLYEDISFEEIDGAWVPVEMSRLKRNLWPKGHSTTTYHDEITEIRLNPDFDALDAFSPHFIPDGAKVYFEEEKESTHIWKDGKPVSIQDVKEEENLLRKKRSERTVKILEKLRESHTIPQRFSVRVTGKRTALFKGKYNNSVPSPQQRIITSSSFEISVDGEKRNMVHTRKRAENGVPSPGEVYFRVLWDGTRGLCTQNNTGLPTVPGKHNFISFTDTQDRARRDTESWFGLSLLWKKLPMDPRPLPAILFDASAVHVSERMELVDSHLCYLIEAESKWGKHKVWVDPDYGHNIRKAIVTRKGKDLYGARELPLDYPAGKMPSAAAVQTGQEVLVDGIEIEKIDNLFFITKSHERITQTYTHGAGEIVNDFRAQWDFNLSPDFESAGTFKWDVPEGMKMYSEEDKSIQYELRDGKIVSISE